MILYEIILVLPEYRVLCCERNNTNKKAQKLHASVYTTNKFTTLSGHHQDEQDHKHAIQLFTT